jgi:hypothetical protein
VRQIGKKIFVVIIWAVHRTHRKNSAVGFKNKSQYIITSVLIGKNDLYWEVNRQENTDTPAIRGGIVVKVIVFVIIAQENFGDLVSCIEIVINTQIGQEYYISTYCCYGNQFG